MSESEARTSVSNPEDGVAEATPPTKRAPTDAAPTGTPAYPAFAPKRGLFVGLIVLYALVIAALIALSVAQHRGMLSR